VPWHVSKGSGCPDGKPYAVVRETDNHVEGCHPTRTEANNHMRALYSNEGKGTERYVQTRARLHPGPQR
jgi:hypothetical protein